MLGFNRIMCYVCKMHVSHKASSKYPWIIFNPFCVKGEVCKQALALYNGNP